MKVYSLYLVCLICFVTFKNASAQNRSIFEPVKIELKSYDKSERYKQHEGKRIRKIKIVVLEPFGKTVEDTTINRTFWTGEIGNVLHISTRQTVIENLLLIREGEPFDALATQETERLIRDAIFIRDSKVIVSEIDENTVDITFVVSDRWTINADVISTRNPVKFRLYENNFLGLAHQISNTFSYDFEKHSNFALSGRYTIPYIHNTYTSITAHYGTSPFTQTKGLIFNRSFFSILTTWAGGIEVMENFESVEPDLTNGINPFEARFNVQDYWIGRNFKINKNDRRTGIGIAARIKHVHYNLKPSPNIDTLNLYQNSVFILGTIAYNFRQYYIDQNIYRFGVTEDVPTGFILALTGGYQRKELFSRPYIRTRLAYGEHFPGFGNISAGIDFGTFLHKAKAEQGSLNYSISYFSDMFKIGNWGIRQFVYSLSYIGINRLPNESVRLSSDNELYGFPGVLTGTKKIALNFQTVLYAPFSIMGFRFAPVFLIGLGMLGDNESPLFSGTVYQSYGTGILIRNENFAFRTFQLSIAIYPYSPNFDEPNYSINPVGTYDLRYQDFFIQKPGEVPYR